MRLLPSAAALTMKANMPPRPIYGETQTDTRAIILAWVLAGIMLAVVALLPPGDVGELTQTPTAIGVSRAPAHSVPAMQGRKDDCDLLGACDFDPRESNPAVQNAGAGGTRYWTVPENSHERDQC